MKGFKTRLALLLALGVAPAVYADQTFTVTTFSDLVDTNLGDGVCLTVDSTCSLRAAVQEANLYPIASGRTTIEIPVHGIYYLDGAAGEQGAATGDLDIKEYVVINGAGSDVVAIDGSHNDRIFDVHDRANLTLNDLSVRNGFVDVPGIDPNLIQIREDYRRYDGGGGIKVSGGRLTLNRVNVTDNEASVLGGGIDIMPGEDEIASRVEINASNISNNIVTGFGGGISNLNSVLVINDSTISENQRDTQDIIYGGGIFNSGWDNSLVINRTTISNNSAYLNGGGIYHQLGELMVINSTISGNVARRWGGGLYNADASGQHDTELQHVTITENISLGVINENTGFSGPRDDPRGSGIYNRGKEAGAQTSAHLRLLNSIVALNDALGGDCYNDIFSDVNYPARLDKQGTLIGDDSCRNQGEGIDPINYRIDIAPLQYNGGATLTHALLSTSDAVDRGVSAYCEGHDQRKYGPRGTASCDSGAFEADAGIFEPLVVPAIPFGGEPPSETAPSNQVPQAFDLLTIVTPGGSVEETLPVLDPDGPQALYTFGVGPTPTKGTLVWANQSSGTFRYTANGTSTGVDSFGYSLCDGYRCDQGVVSVVINDASVESSVVATVTAGDGTPSPVTVISSNDLSATMSDPDFTYPLGAMFFDISGVTGGEVTVTLELAAGQSIEPDAVVRKQNRFGSWMTLSSVYDPNLSSAFFTPASGGNPATVTLTLIDNDIFDHDLATGMISDPVALAVSSAEPDPGPTSNGGGGGGGSGGSDSTGAAEGGGGGIAGAGWLGLLLLFGLVRRRRSVANLN